MLTSSVFQSHVAIKSISQNLIYHYNSRNKCGFSCSEIIEITQFPQEIRTIAIAIVFTTSDMVTVEISPYHEWFIQTFKEYFPNFPIYSTNLEDFIAYFDAHSIRLSIKHFTDIQNSIKFCQKVSSDCEMMLKITLHHH